MTVLLTRRTTTRLRVSLCAAAVGVVAASSAAWACTPIMGKGSLDGAKAINGTLEGGPRGSTVTMTTGWLKTFNRITGDPLPSPAVFRILFYDRDSVAELGEQCMTSARSFVMKRTDGTKAKNVPAPSNGDAKPDAPDAGHSGAFVVALKVPSVFPTTHAWRPGQQIPLGKSVICGMEQGPAEVPGAPGPTDDTGTAHLRFKVTSV